MFGILEHPAHLLLLILEGGAYVPTLSVAMYATVIDRPRQRVHGEGGASCQKRVYSASHGPVPEPTG